MKRQVDSLQKLKAVGIIGCGRIAGGYDPVIPEKFSATHAGAYHLCKKTVLVAASDPSESARNAFREKWGVKNIYAGFEEMLETEELDILSICLPTPLHYKAACAAKARGIPAIFLEKPLSDDLKEAAAIRDMLNDSLVAVNYFRRWNPTLAALRAALKQKKMGQPISVVVRYTKGILVNGSHLVDLARWFWGEPEEIRYLQTVKHDNTDPGIDFLLIFKGGFPVYFLNIPDADYVFIDMDIVLEKGRVVMGQRGQSLMQWEVTLDPNFRLFNILGNPREVKTHWQNCTTRAVEELVTCMEGGGTPACTLDDGFRALEICHHVISQAIQ